MKGCKPNNLLSLGHTQLRASGCVLATRLLASNRAHGALCAARFAAASCLHVQDVLNLVVVHVLRVVPPPQLRPPVRLIVPAHEPLMGSAPAVLHLEACNAL